MNVETLKSALVEYDKTCAAVENEYDKARAVAWNEYDKICDAAQNEYDKACAVALNEYDKIRDAAWSEYKKIRDAAWNEIAAKVNDPLVSWIVKECAGYQFEAIRILSLLPCPLSELDEFATEQEWCGIWEGFRAKALEAGVIEDL